jgi:hypothetical protein
LLLLDRTDCILERHLALLQPAVKRRSSGLRTEGRLLLRLDGRGFGGVLWIGSSYIGLRLIWLMVDMGEERGVEMYLFSDRNLNSFQSLSLRDLASHLLRLSQARLSFGSCVLRFACLSH